MRKLFWQMMMSLDGLMEGPKQELDWFVTGDEFGQFVLEMENRSTPFCLDE